MGEFLKFKNISTSSDSTILLFDPTAESSLAVQKCSLPGKSLAVKDKTLIGACRYAYVEFTEPSLVNNAIVLNESIFRGRSLKVRRTNPTQVC